MGNNHSEHEQPKGSSLLGKDIERGKTIQPVVPEKTAEPTKPISKSRDASPSLHQLNAVADGLFQSVCTPTSSIIGQGPHGPQATAPPRKSILKTPTLVPPFSSDPALLKKQRGDLWFLDKTPKLAESPVRPLAPEHKPPQSSRSYKLAPAIFNPPPAPRPQLCQHKDTSLMAPIQPHAAEQKAAIRNPTKVSSKQPGSTNPDAATPVAPAKTQEPSKELLPTKGTPVTAAAPSGECDPTIAGSPESDEALSFNVPPDFPLTQKTLKKLIDHRFEYILKQESIPPPPHRQAAVRRALNGEPYSEAVKGPTTKVNPARREAKARKNARVSRSSNKPATDPPGSDSSSARPSQPPDNPTRAPSPSAPTVAHEPFKLSAHAEPFKSMVYPMFNYPVGTPVPISPLLNQAPSSPLVTQGPSSPLVTQAPISRLVTKGPSSPLLTQRPISPLVTQGPSSPLLTQAPISRLVTKGPSSPQLTQRPISPLVTQGPSSPLLTQRPISPLVTQGSSSTLFTQAPISPLVTQGPSSPLLTQGPISPLVTQGPSSPLLTQAPISPLVTQGPSSPLLTQGPNSPLVTQTPISPLVTQAPSIPTPANSTLASDSGRGKHTRIPVPIKTPASIEVPKEKKEPGSQAQVTDTQGTRVSSSSSSSVKPARSTKPHCSPKSEQGRAFAAKTRLKLKSKAQPTEGNQVLPENAAAPSASAKPAKPPSEKKSSQHRSGAVTKEKKSEADPLRTAQATYEAESKILMERFRKYSTDKSTKDSTQVTVTTHSEYHFYSGYETPDAKCPFPSFTMPKMGDASMCSDLETFMEYWKGNPTTPPAAEAQSNQSAASDVSPPTAPETAQGATTVASPAQRKEQAQSKAARQDEVNQATLAGDETPARPDAEDTGTDERPDEEDTGTDERPDEASPERPSRPSGLWPPFTVDRSCSRKAHCQHNNPALPRNVTKWLNVSRNYLCEPHWVTTATLAASLALKERLGGGECVQ